MPYPNYDRWKPVVIEVSAWVLAISASMILGLLSFSGMLAIWPSLFIAFSAFLFSIVIEGEIYLESIRSALGKSTEPKVYERQLSAIYLQERLVDFDKNLDLLLLRQPTEDEKKQVCDHHQIVIWPEDSTYKIGFRNQNGVFETKVLNANQSKFLKHYTLQEQFLEMPGHHEHIQNILEQLNGSVDPRPQQQYPLFIKAYISQCRYVRRLNCYLHTQPLNAERQQELEVMNAHLQRLEEELSDDLFQATQPTSVSENVEFSFPDRRKKNTSYYFELQNLTFHPKVGGLANITFANDSKKPFKDITERIKKLPDNSPLLANLSDHTYQFHRNKLMEWISPDRAAWKARLSTHTLYSRIAFVISAFSGLIMGIGTTYLIMDAMVAIPWLAALPLTLFPPMIAPLALIAGVAYGLLIYDSLTDMLLDDPFEKFFARFETNFREMTLKKGIFLGLSLALLLVTIVLTICTAGTWLTVFHQTKPLFTWLNHIPNRVLNSVIPILIGMSILPFSIQSISNTLQSLEENPDLDKMIDKFNPRNWRAPNWEMPHNLTEATNWVSERIWQKWVPGFLGLTPEEFAAETLAQKRNPYRIVYKLFFEPLRALIFVGHLIAAGATSDQVEGVPVIVSFLLNFVFECAEDWDWIWARAHLDNLNTSDLLKERSQKSDNHNHDNNIPMRLLNFVFEPILKRAAEWDIHYRNGDKSDQDYQKSYDKIKGRAAPAPAPLVPVYRKENNFNMFLFKSAVYEKSAPVNDTCCTNLALSAM